jgi:aminoglycoside phosphotransferase (APT) family kinase protein
MAADGWRIRIERSGGFAGVTLGGEVRSDELSSEEAEEFERLAGAVDFARYGDAAQAPQPGQPDRFEYHLLIDHDSEHHDVTVGETGLDPPLKELVQWLMARVRTSKTKSKN